MLNSYIEYNNAIWLRFSVFYSRNRFHELIFFVEKLYYDNKSYFKHFSIYTGSMQGERLNIIVSPYDKNMVERIILKIEMVFKDFLMRHQSKKEDPNSFIGKLLWSDYCNNSTEWNKFSIPQDILHNSLIAELCYANSTLIMRLYDKESSYSDNIIALGTFIVTKLCYYSLSPKNKMVSIKRVNSASSLNSDLLNRIEPISQYWLYEIGREHGTVFQSWEQEVNRIYESIGIRKGFIKMFLCITYQLNISRNFGDKILEMIRDWNTNLFVIPKEEDIYSIIINH